MNEHGFFCPYCGSASVRRSRRKGLIEAPKMLFGIYPFRCLACGARFFGNVWLLTTAGYTNCPKCLRLSVHPAVKREGQLTAFDRLRSSLGARAYRCVACRHTYLSFRKCLALEEKQTNYSGTTHTTD